MHPLLAFVYGSEPVTFGSDLPLSQAVAGLRTATAKSVFHTLVQQAAAGTVSEHNVSLQRAVPFVGNSFKPFFVGRFETQHGRTVLQGAFTMHWGVKLFMSLWFGFCLIWTMLAIVAVLAKPTELWFFPLAGVGMLIAGVALVKVGMWFARNDRDYLSKVIVGALAKNVA